MMQCVSPLSTAKYVLHSVCFPFPFPVCFISVQTSTSLTWLEPILQHPQPEPVTEGSFSEGDLHDILVSVLSPVSRNPLSVSPLHALKKQVCMKGLKWFCRLAWGQQAQASARTLCWLAKDLHLLGCDPASLSWASGRARYHLQPCSHLVLQR